jgi:ribosomal protein S27AE
MKFDRTAGLYRCPKCLHRVNAPAESLEQASARIRERGARPAVPITFRYELDARARTLFEQGHDAIWNDDPTAARRFFEQSLGMQPDFVDAYLALASLADDPTRKRDYIEHALAHDPGNAEALRHMMILTGRMDAAAAERSRDPNAAPDVRAMPEAAVTTARQTCPVCGGRLSADADGRRVTCAFCGYDDPIDTAKAARGAAAGGDVLGMALLEQRAAPVKWVIGRRILHCDSCGAQRTITRADAAAIKAAGGRSTDDSRDGDGRTLGQFSLRCPFCGSAHVVLNDALNTIRQPTHLIPFAVDQDDAQAAIQKALSGVGEKLMGGLFKHNQVVCASVAPTYVPFWVFDGLLRVTQSRIDKRTPRSYQERETMRPYERIEYTDSMTGVCVPGVAALPAELVTRIGSFDLSRAVPYQPALLADRPAALPDIPFDRAALDAQSHAAAHMRRRYEQDVPSEVEVNTFTLPIQMTFTLMLLPVWVGTLIERDGDARTALVHGQTGRAAVGRG